ncbi:MAG: serine hydrolase domain-containing protein [Chitinophagaceae bacterium]
MLCITLSLCSSAQPSAHFADSIRIRYHIPELAYAVVSSDGVTELNVSGVQQYGTQHMATINDRFRIGSNTKAVTAFIAALLVQQGKISWHTRFFDLYPELKAGSNKAYHQLTLEDLLSFRAPLFAYTYTYSRPRKQDFKGDDAQQRYAFTQWFFRKAPVRMNDSIQFSNLGYVAAALMMERASGKDYKTLVRELGRQYGISFGFGPPAASGTDQPWGHNDQLQAEAPADNYKLNWLLAAGNINVSLPDYLKFIQEQLRGLNGKSAALSRETFRFLHFGKPQFALGWFHDTDETGASYSHNTGNPGSFLSKVYVFPERDRAFILFANVQSEEAETGMELLFAELKRADRSAVAKPVR